MNAPTFFLTSLPPLAGFSTLPFPKSREVLSRGNLFKNKPLKFYVQGFIITYMNSTNCKVLLITLLLGVFLGCVKETVSAGLKDKILYVCGEGICTINPDGTDRKVIVPIEKGVSFSNAKWSPDKLRIAFTRITEGNTRIILVDHDGSNRKLISLPGSPERKLIREEKGLIHWKYDLEFREWSTSGKFLLYRTGPVLEASVFGVISTEGEVIAQLNGSFYATFGANDHLVYMGYYGGVHAIGSDIFTYDIWTKEKRNLTNTKGQKPISFYPVQSLDGEMIAYKYSISRNTELWIMHSDGSGKRRLASLGKDFQSVAWGTLSFSPDGDKIMYVSYDGDKSQIYIINTDGTELKAITDKIVKGFGGADWSPDGEHIIFTSNKEGNDELYIINVDGSGLVRLTNNETPDCCPDW